MIHSRSTPRQNCRLDIVVPLYNEQEVIRQLHTRLIRTAQRLPIDYRVIYVDDGSQDRTIEKLMGAMTTDENVELIRLSRNFGQSSAIQAGLAACDGDCVVVMDGDLQDPPELIAELVERWMMGFEVVIARRTDRDEESWLRKMGFVAFHKLFKWFSDHPIPTNCGTFCLLDGAAARAIGDLPESHRFFPGLRSWVGFEQGFVDYARPRRAAGTPKQTFSRLLRYAADGIFSFSTKPARILTWLGLLQLIGGTVATIGLVIFQLLSRNGLAIDWPLGLSFIAVLGGVQLLGLGLIAHLGFRIYDQVKSRPRYVIQNQATLGLRHDQQPGTTDEGQRSKNDDSREPQSDPESNSPSADAIEPNRGHNHDGRSPQSQRRAG